MDLTQIQHAIEKLPEDQQVELALWLTERKRTRWDEEIEHDSSPDGARAELLLRVKNRVMEIGRSCQALAYRKGTDFH